MGTADRSHPGYPTAFPLLTAACGGAITPEKLIALQAELDAFMAAGRAMFAPAEPASTAELMSAAFGAPVTILEVPLGLTPDEARDWIATATPKIPANTDRVFEVETPDGPVLNVMVGGRQIGEWPLDEREAAEWFLAAQQAALRARKGGAR
jgi:hypothetical protein